MSLSTPLTTLRSLPRRLGAAAALALALPCAAARADTDYSAAYRRCMDQSGGVTVTMIECISVEHERHDQRLNAGYSLLMATLTPARRKQLQAVQRQWIAYRDANCRFYADPDGGTAARLAANSCMLEMTAQRAREFESLQPRR